MSMNWHEYISVDPNICHAPTPACIAGTRVVVTCRSWTGLAAGLSAEEITREAIRHVSADAVKAALL